MLSLYFFFFFFFFNDTATTEIYTLSLHDALPILIAGDLALRRRPVAAALDNAAHLATGAALAGLAYAKLGGAKGAQALPASNPVPLVAFPALLPFILNHTFIIYLALALTIARAAS